MKVRLGIGKQREKKLSVFRMYKGNQINKTFYIHSLSYLDNKENKDLDSSGNTQ